MLLDGFDLKIQNIPYFDQSVAYVAFNHSVQAACHNMTAYQLRYSEKEFLQRIMNKAVLHVQTRDTKMCCEYACSIILDDTKMFKLATATLRPQVAVTKITIRR